MNGNYIIICLFTLSITSLFTWALTDTFSCKEEILFLENKENKSTCSIGADLIILEDNKAHCMCK